MRGESGGIGQVGVLDSPVGKEAQERPQDGLDHIFENARRVSETAIEFDIDDPNGLELFPGHSLAFVVPAELQGRVVRDVVLRHRKAEKYRANGTKEHDPDGAYTRVELHDSGSEQWLGWRDPKGYSPDKYAEWRPAGDPEVEVLHDWLATVGEVQPDAVRVTSVGKNPDLSVSQIHGLEVTFFPELEGVTYEERVYTPGTSFIDIESGKLLPTYGGGSSTNGIYENAVVLNGQVPASFEVCKEPGSDVELTGRSMLIDLKAGKKLVQAEVSVGDTEHLNHVSQKTGRPTRLGYAKLSVGIQRASSGEIEWFVNRANVPPQGVIAGSPNIELADIHEGDKLVVQSGDDTSYVMAYRIAYSEEEDEQVLTLSEN